MIYRGHGLAGFDAGIVGVGLAGVEAGCVVVVGGVTAVVIGNANACAALTLMLGSLGLVLLKVIVFILIGCHAEELKLKLTKS